MRHRSGMKKPWLTALVVTVLPGIVSGLAVSAPGAGESRPAAEKKLGWQTQLEYSDFRNVVGYFIAQTASKRERFP